MRTHTYFRLFTVSILLCLSSCKKDYLDVVNQLAPEVTMQKVFNDPVSVRQFYANIFTGIPNSSLMIIDGSYTGVNGLQNPWPACSDELKAAQNNVRNIASNGYNAGNAALGRWGLLYPLIRQANLFLENIHSTPQASSDYISETEIPGMKAVARFLRAYYHYLLFEQYGPIPIMSHSVSNTDPVLDFARNNVDEVVKFISDEMTAVAPQLADMSKVDGSDKLLPTKGVALAVKAKLLVYAASPLFNGGFSEALQLKNKDGKSLFPATDPQKWQTAKTALEDFLNFANGKYDLFRLNKNGVYNADTSLYALFMEVNNNKEVIWANNRTSWGALDGEGNDRRCTPRSERSGYAGLGVTQELVDAFFMIDGKSIQASSLYSETGFSAAGDDPSGRTKPGTFRMYINREPRFYQTVMYQNRNYHISNNQIQFQKGSGNDNSVGDNPYTGYLLYKNVPRNTRNEGSYPRSQFRPSIIFRLAEFYLLYAEACNEVNPNDPKILQYLDMVRDRAGIPKLADINPGLLGNKDALRQAIQAERRVELCTEGQRYFDVRRWMIAENPVGQGGQGGPATGMNMNSNVINATGAGTFFSRVNFESRVFTRAMYLYPIPQAEILKSSKLIQNPLW